MVPTVDDVGEELKVEEILEVEEAVVEVLE